MKMGRKITLVLFQELCRRDKDELMDDTCVKIPKITGSSDKEDMEEDVDAAGKEDGVNMHETCQLEKKIGVNINETLLASGSENAKDHKFIRMKLVTMLIWMAET